MKNTMNKIICAVQALSALVLLGAIKIWAPVCGKMLTLTSGKEVPMKCFWTSKAAMAVAVILLTVAVLGFFAKTDGKKFFIASAVAGVVLFLVFGSLMGVCASAEMRCNVTALWGRIVAGVVVAGSLVGLLAGKDGQVPN